MELNLETQFIKIIKKEVTYQSKSMAFNLLITRLQKKYAAEQTEEVLYASILEMKDFFAKYSSLLQKELDTIKKI